MAVPLTIPQGVECAVCHVYVASKHSDDFIAKKCDAGCGRIVVFKPDVLPEALPKVCRVCATWLSNCQGNA